MKALSGGSCDVAAKSFVVRVKLRHILRAVWVMLQCWQGLKERRASLMKKSLGVILEELIAAFEGQGGVES